jgi:dihydroflavonol-4-reductase
VTEGRVLVTGGSGVVGRAIVERLVRDGREVVALARTDTASETLRALGARAERGDVLDERSIREAARGCSILFHVAGVNALCLRDPSAMYATNVEGTANAIRAAAAAGVPRVVVTSSASTLGEPSGEIGTERSEHRRDYLSHYERSKHLAERVAFAVGTETGVEIVCVNPSSVQGPGRVGGSARLLLELMNRPRLALVDVWISLVDIADCAEGHLLAARRGGAGERYVLSGASITTRDAVEIVRRLWGRPDAVRWVPGWTASAGGALAELYGGVTRRDVPVCREAIRTLRHGHRYDGSRATRDLGLTYTPLESTLERTLAWYAEQDLIPPRRDTTTAA